MSKNKYQSLANASKSKEQEKSESQNPQPSPQSEPESQDSKGRSPLKFVLLLFAVPIVLIGLSEVFRSCYR
jgi:hypothetical protein